MNNILKFRIFLWSVLGLAVLWLLYMGVVPGGKITYFRDFDDPDYFIRKLTPAERLEAPADGGIKIIGDPVYFSLRTPRRFDQAFLTLKYRRSQCRDALLCVSSQDKIPIIEAGVLVDKTVWRYDLKPVENKIIDMLAMAWDNMRKDNLILLQRKKNYNTVEDFLGSLPLRGEIAVYNYSPEAEYLLPNYASSSELKTITSALRGAYQFYTYIKDEPLSFMFGIVDLNLNRDSDAVDINLYYNNEMIDTRRLEDDNISSDTGAASDLRQLEIKSNNLPEGVYKIEFKANDDIVTKEIITSAAKLAFINNLRLADSGYEGIAIYTDSSELHAKTVNPAKLQTIRLNGQELELKETYRQYDSTLNASTTELILAHDDAIISGDGVFSFTRGELINPSFKKVRATLDINKIGINYVLADYSIPEEEGGWRIARASLDLKEAYREDGSYSFIISIPRLKADDEIDDYVELGEIKVELEGKRLWEKMKEIF